MPVCKKFNVKYISTLPAYIATHWMVVLVFLWVQVSLLMIPLLFTYTWLKSYTFDYALCL